MAGASEGKRESISSRVLAIPPQGGATESVWGMLNDIIDILGTNKRSFWPFIESTGNTVRNLSGAGSLNSQDEGGNVNLEDEFTPIVQLRASGIYSYFFSGDNSRHLVAADNADHSFEGASEVFSGAVWVSLRETGSAVQTLMAKYDEGVASEWTFHLSSAEALTLQMFDGIDGVTGDIVAVDTGGAIVRDKMTLVGFSFNGGADTGVVSFYVNGLLVSAITVTETGSYVNMDDTAAKMFVGGRDDGGAPDDLYDGWLALPMVTGKNLSTAEHLDLYRISRNLVGV